MDIYLNVYCENKSVILCGLKTDQICWVNVGHPDGEERRPDGEKVSVVWEEIRVAHLEPVRWQFGRWTY